MDAIPKLVARQLGLVVAGLRPDRDIPAGLLGLWAGDAASAAGGPVAVSAEHHP
jgi:hypothetical protein